MSERAVQTMLPLGRDEPDTASETTTPPRRRPFRYPPAARSRWSAAMTKMARAEPPPAN